MSQPLTLGTAGHIDHGKTALVLALTGTDTDRLPEERERGMSIALGYAQLELPGGRRLSVVDVPGHERFVRTMVAGATGIDLFLMVIAADDGVMPQTREHAAVLRALDVRDGVVAITKSDVADPGQASAEAAELLPGMATVPCASPSGAGLEALRDELAAVATRLEPRGAEDAGAVLHVDRVFTVHGAGTVVTGTLWQGAIAEGDRVTILPGGREARVRSVQVHDAGVSRAAAGQRVALNLGGIRRDEVARGDVIAGPGAAVAVTTVIDARLELSAAKHGQRVHVHHGTRETPARLADLGEGFWQLRLDTPLLAADGERVVVRAIAPPDTLGGGVIVDARARRHGRAAAHRERLAGPVGEAAAKGAEAAKDAAAGGGAKGAAGGARAKGVAGARGAAPSPAALELAERLRAAAHEPPTLTELGDDAALIDELRQAELVVRLGRDRYAHVDAVAAVRARVEALIARDGAVTLAALRDDLATSRQFAQALLEHLDSARVTRRLPDDRRVLRRNVRG